MFYRLGLERMNFYFPPTRTDRLRFVCPLLFLFEHRLETIHVEIDSREDKRSSRRILRGPWLVEDKEDEGL